MNPLLAAVMFFGGLVLVIYFAEKLVEGVVGTSLNFGISAFVISVVFIGFDPENLAVGAIGSYEGISGIAVGSIVGAAMVATGLAFGVTALICPMRFEQVPRLILTVPIVALGTFAVLVWDGRLSRLDGGILLACFAVSVVGLIWMSRRGMDVQPGGEVAETLEKEEVPGRWKSAGLMLLSLAAIIGGSEMLVISSRSVIDWLGLAETFFGMTILALLVSVEEVARELPAAMKGRPEISYGNVVGSMLAFFCFNAGVIALVRPVTVESEVTTFYLPVCGATVLVTTAAMLASRVPRWVGAVLVLLYVLFVAGGYGIGGTPAGRQESDATTEKVRHAEGVAACGGVHYRTGNPYLPPHDSAPPHFAAASFFLRAAAFASPFSQMKRNY